MKRVGWMPWCIGNDGPGGNSCLGPWPAWTDASRKKAERVKENSGFRFRIVPVYVRERKAGRGG